MTLIDEIMAREFADLPRSINPRRLAKQVLDEAIGLGPLEDLIDDNTVTEIMVNAFDQIYIERNGRIEKSEVCFTSERAVLSAIERIVTPLGRRIDESSPMVDARLKDGSRVNAIIPPVALRGASVSIRKFAKRKLTGEDLLTFGSMDQAMLDFLAIVRKRLPEQMAERGLMGHAARRGLLLRREAARLEARGADGPVIAAGPPLIRVHTCRRL